MLRNKNEEPAQPSSPQSPGEQSKSVEKEVSYQLLNYISIRNSFPVNSLFWSDQPKFRFDVRN